MFETLESQPHKLFVYITVQLQRDLPRDIRDAGLTVTALPDQGRRMVEGVGSVTFKIIHDSLGN